MMVSTNPDVRALVRRALKRYPYLRLECGSTYRRLRSERSRDFIQIPFTPSDVRAVKNLRSQIRRLAEQGCGLIAAKQSR
jgi:hypothetical protein